MKPYYDQDGITIYNGDCLEVLSSLGEFDMVFTSPPYNLGENRSHDKSAGGKWRTAELADGYANHDDALPLAEYEDWQRKCLSMMWDHLTDSGAIFYNHKPRIQGRSLWTPMAMNPDLPVRQIITWARSGGLNYDQTHYVPTFEWIIIFARFDWMLKSHKASGVGDLWRVPQEINTKHPAPFPVGLPARAIETVAPSTILDPFMGSGTSMRAAKDAGIRGVGIELSEKYCEMAVKRLAQGSFFGEAA